MPDICALRLRRFSKTFGSHRVLDDFSLDLTSGTIHSVVGHNGSGKSTLVKLLSGFHQPDEGAELEVDGRPVRVADHTAAHQAGLRFVHQDLGLARSLNAVDNIALGNGYPHSRLGRIRWGAARQHTRDLLHSLGCDVDIDAPLSTISAGQRTAVAIARALSAGETGEAGDMGARVLVLDEPTATMARSEYDDLRVLVTALARRGAAVLFISHHLDEVLDISDDLTVLREGRIVGRQAARTLDKGQLVRLMIGPTLAAKPLAAQPLAAQPRLHDPRPSGEVALDVEALTTRTIRPLDLGVRVGEVVGVAGLDGSGRDEVVAALAGLTARGGRVTVAGVRVPPSRPGVAVRAGLGAVLADRSANGVLPTMSTGWNLTVTDVGRYARGPVLSASRERQDTVTWMARLAVRPPVPEHPMVLLSGGNQQKVILGRWLRQDPRVLLLEEPTQGVDVGARTAIHQEIAAAARTAAVLVSSSDAGELVDLCDRVLVLRGGSVVADLTAPSLTVDLIEGAALSGEVAA